MLCCIVLLFVTKRRKQQNKHKTQITKLKYADIKNEPCNRKNAFKFAHGKHELKFKNIPYNPRCLIET